MLQLRNLLRYLGWTETQDQTNKIEQLKTELQMAHEQNANWEDRVQELNTQLQMAHDHNNDQENQIVRLSAELEFEKEDYEIVFDQVEYLSKELNKAQNLKSHAKDMLCIEQNRCAEARAEIYQLKGQVRELRAQQETDQKRREQELQEVVERENSYLREIEDLKKLNTELQMAQDTNSDWKDQAQELKIQLQMLQEENSNQEKRIVRLSAELEFEKKDYSMVFDQVEYLSKKLNKAHDQTNHVKVTLRREQNRCLEVRAENLQLEKQVRTLREQLDFLKDQEELLINSEQECRSELQDLQNRYREMSRKYEAALSAEQEKSANLQQQLDMERSCPDRCVSQDSDELRRLAAEIEGLEELNTELQMAQDTHSEWNDQVQELNIQPQKLKEENSNQEKRIVRLSAELEFEKQDYSMVFDQVEYLSKELCKAEDLKSHAKEMLRIEQDRCAGALAKISQLEGQVRDLQEQLESRS